LYFAAVYAVVGWVLSRAWPQVTSGTSFDAALGALRTRPDLAIAACGLSVFGAIAAVLCTQAYLRLGWLYRQLGALSVCLAGADFWNLFLEEIANAHKRRWNRVARLFQLLPACFIAAGLLAFFAPATVASVAVRCAFLGSLIFLCSCGFLVSSLTRRLP
jgi:hypothetical protein